MQSIENETRAARAQLRRRAAEIKTEELDRALSSLNSEIDLTDTQREIVEEMSDAIVEEILAPLEARVERAPDDEQELVRTAVSLFEIRDESRSDTASNQQ